MKKAHLKVRFFMKTGGATLATRQHYLSKAIIKNFITQDNETFLVYNCESKTSTTRNINKLFAKFRSWDPWFENELDKKFENELSPIINKYVKIDIQQPAVELVGNHITIYPMSGFQIQSSKDSGIISKLLSQQILVQLSNRSDRSGVPDEATISLFSKSRSNFMHPAIFETNTEIVKDPLIITDGMPFMFIAPVDDTTKLGHLCFMFPISERRFFIWGNESDCDFFVRKYCNITYLNLCRIEQQDKKCAIASQNFEYISKITSMIEGFHSGEQIKIESIRDAVALNKTAKKDSV